MRNRYAVGIPATWAVTRMGARPRTAHHGRHMVDRWFALLVMTRLLGGSVAALLLAVHRVTAHDGVLIVAVLAYTATSLALLRVRPSLRESRVVWVLDGAAVLALVWASEDWRSPFYVLLLTALVLPATALPFGRGVAWGATFTLCYGVVGVLTERLGASTLEDTVRLETAATHLMAPIMVALALAYASKLLARLAAERRRSEHLAVQAERQRIAWELHDSAKQRVHAAHLVLSGLPRMVDGRAAELVDHALAEMRAATADMETSVGELQAPTSGDSVDELLRRRADELAPASTARIDVVGRLPEMPAAMAAHCHRIASEALTNAVRHAGASTITVGLDPLTPAVMVADDGRGIPAGRRPGSHGLRTMQDRAQTIGADLSIHSGADGRGTVVHLRLSSLDQGSHA